MLDALPLEEMFDEFEVSPNIKRTWSNLLYETE